MVIMVSSAGDPYVLAGEGAAGIISVQELLEVFSLQDDTALDAVSTQQAFFLESEQLFLAISNDVVTGIEGPKIILEDSCIFYNFISQMLASQLPGVEQILKPLQVLVANGDFLSSYMSCQAKINTRLRAILVDWIILVQYRLTLMPEILYFNVHVFIVQYLEAAKGDRELENMAFFYSELALVQYPMLIYPPLVTAAAAIYAARSTLQMKPPWTDILEYVQVTIRLQLLIAQSMFRFQGASVGVSSWDVSHFVQSCLRPLTVYGCLLSMPGEHGNIGKLQVQDTRTVGAVGKPLFVLLFYNLMLEDS